MYVKKSDAVVQKCVNSDFVCGIYYASGIAPSLERILGKCDAREFIFIGFLKCE